ncbi:hypothetical protein BDQ17DRAFT_1359446 [Cyathus striatus]|nr:hypothetical protein BDQ17DRAFT_1359446 [Cyathus striatus]
MFFTPHLLLALFATVSLASRIPNATTVDLNPPLSVVHNYLHLRAPAIPQSQELALTNAERLRAGLPLRKPAPRRPIARQVASSAAPLATPAAVYPAAIPATSKYDRGFLQMLDAESGNVIGFVSRVFNQYGQYGAIAKDYDRLLVFINLAEAESETTDIITANGPDVNFPSFGPITGASSASFDLEAGSSNYAHIGGLRSTEKGSGPVIQANSFTAATGISKTAESMVWSYDSETGFLSAHWINTDLTRPTLHLGRVQEVLVVTGDRDAFVGTYGAAEWIVLQFVPL